MATPTSPIGTQNEGRIYLGVTSSTVEKTADYDIVLADRGKLFRFSGAGPYIAQIMTVAISSPQFMCFIRNDCATDLTIEVESGNLNGGPTLTVEPGLLVMVFCDGTNTLSGGINLNCLPLIGGTMLGDLILNGDPTVALQAATKQYVDTVATGIAVQPLCYAATTANLNATYANGAAGVGATLTNAGALAAFSLDGTSPALNSRILVKNQTNLFENGCYTLTTVGSGAVAWVLTRATDYDTAAEIQPGTLFMVTNGTVNAVTSWVETNPVVTVGTDPIAFAQFTFSPGSYANTALSNLAATSVNAAIIPSGDNLRDLGTTAIGWRDIYSRTVVSPNTGGLAFAVWDTGTATYKAFMGSVVGNPATAVIADFVTGTTQAANDNSTKLATTAYVQNQITSQGANKALSNLAGVAVNTTLVSDTDITDDLGTQAIRWRNIYANTLQTGDTAADVLTIGAWDVDGAALTPFITLTANNTPSCALASGVTGVTQAPNDNSTKLATTAYVDAAVTGGGAGALVFIASVTASASATMDFNNVFTSTYENYEFILNNIRPSLADYGLNFQVGTGAGPTYQTTNYSNALGIFGISNTGATFYTVTGNTVGTGVTVTGSSTSGNATTVTNTANYALGGSLKITNTQSTVNYKSITSSCCWATNNPAGTRPPAVSTLGAFWNNATTALTSGRFYMTSGDIQGGVIRLYAYKNS